MKRNLLFIAIALLSFSLMGGNCEKSRADFEALPAATQQGKNAMGFLLNEKPWVPNGGNGNLMVDMDMDEKSGVFTMIGSKNDGSSGEQLTIDISDSMNIIYIPHTFKIFPYSILNISYTKSPCEYSSKDAGTVSQGALTVLKLDKTNRIVSGTFNATLNKQGCPEVRITEGRFDMKY